MQTLALDPGRPPQQVRPGLWLFAPSRDSQGGSSWLLEAGQIGCSGDLLVDCPGYTEANLAFLRQRSSEQGPGRLVLTSREGHGRCRRLQEALGLQVVVQEQEAYLLPGIESCLTFAEKYSLGPGLELLWTPGPTPGASVLHCQVGEVDGLFCGRLLLPVAPGQLQPLRTARTFHWPRQLASLWRLTSWLPSNSPQWIACGGALGALRGEKLVLNGAEALAQLDLSA
ncbi:MBL fold metallo-hydrolase [Cyanobium sp. HWJ4-Hawea]|uniref:MBL fold metallo-hydrolase n=1 Tax=Cyanobium sp. HWJ4-Hawea TaxID=2823713 RepID=UPI0020CB6FE5|nr:MBL fold metallo-hydrolase [Cyanobium sp. HWJ4-Hawea]MCP9809695.1 MBL fold metallo-hydrolase [Cyanobium sp. HWJ4-Hawea]